MCEGPCCRPRVKGLIRPLIFLEAINAFVPFVPLNDADQSTVLSPVLESQATKTLCCSRVTTNLFLINDFNPPAAGPCIVALPAMLPYKIATKRFQTWLDTQLNTELGLLGSVCGLANSGLLVYGLTNSGASPIILLVCHYWLFGGLPHVFYESVVDCYWLLSILDQVFSTYHVKLRYEIVLAHFFKTRVQVKGEYF